MQDLKWCNEMIQEITMKRQHRKKDYLAAQKEKIAARSETRAGTQLADMNKVVTFY